MRAKRRQETDSSEYLNTSYVMNVTTADKSITKVADDTTYQNVEESIIVYVCQRKLLQF